MDKSPLPISGLFLLNSVFYTFSCSVCKTLCSAWLLPPRYLALTEVRSQGHCPSCPPCKQSSPLWCPWAQCSPGYVLMPRPPGKAAAFLLALCSWRWIVQYLVLWDENEEAWEPQTALVGIWFWKPYTRRAAAEITQGVQLLWIQICCLLVCQSLQIGTSKKQHQHNVCAIWGGRGLTSQQNCRQRICSGDAGTVAICNSVCACVQGTFHDGHVEIRKAHPCQILPQLMCLGPSLACCVWCKGLISYN